MQDENEPDPLSGSSTESIIEMDCTGVKENKWMQQTDLSLSYFVEKNAILKRNDMPDFYTIDKPLDLNSMIRDLFPEYEKWCGIRDSIIDDPVSLSLFASRKEVADDFHIYAYR